MVAINYDATIHIDGIDSQLLGAEEVYLMARAVIDEGAQSIAVTQISNKTKMLSSGKDKWVKYIYPREFFDIAPDAKIKDIYFYMVNRDKTIEVKLPGSGNEFNIPENCN